MENKDYVFHINWEDRHKQSYRVGILAQLDEYFYIILKDQENAKAAYKNGFIGIPGFKPEEVYRSQELFDFFKNRVLQHDGQNPCEELASTKAKSMIDSYSVEKVPDKVVSKYKEVILKAYELQERKLQLQEANKGEKIEDRKDDNKELDELLDIK